MALLGLLYPHLKLRWYPDMRRCFQRQMSISRGSFSIAYLDLYSVRPTHTSTTFICCGLTDLQIEFLLFLSTKMEKLIPRVAFGNRKGCYCTRNQEPILRGKTISDWSDNFLHCLLRIDAKEYGYLFDRPLTSSNHFSLLQQACEPVPPRSYGRK